MIIPSFSFYSICLHNIIVFSKWFRLTPYWKQLQTTEKRQPTTDWRLAINDNYICICWSIEKNWMRDAKCYHHLHHHSVAMLNCHWIQLDPTSTFNGTALYRMSECTRCALQSLKRGCTIRYCDDSTRASHTHTVCVALCLQTASVLGCALFCSVSFYKESARQSGERASVWRRRWPIE